MKGLRQYDTGSSATDGQSVTPLVAGWVVAGGLAVLGLAVLTGGALTIGASWWIVLGLAVAAETVSVDLNAGRSGLSLSLLECVVVVALLLLAPLAAVTAVVAGVLVSHVLRRLPLQKVAFNLGQHAVAGTAAAAVVSLAPAEPVISSPRLAAALAGILVYSVINAVALAGIFARLGLASFRTQLTQRPGFLVATSIGNASVGAMVVTIWSAAPSVLWIVAGPTLALYLSYGSNFRIETLLSEASLERDHLDRVVSGVQEGIVLLDADGLVRLWNPGIVRITGVSAVDALGRPASDLLSGVDADGQLVDAGEPLQSRNTAATCHVILTDAHAERVETRIRHTLVDDDRGRLVGDVVMVQDLSREREAQALKEDFVARVSHELRTPLSPLRAYAQAMLRAGDRISPEKRDEILETMVERVGHLERLIDDLLLVSKVASGTLDPADEVTCAPTDLGEIAERMAEWVGKEHPDRDLRVHGEDDGATQVVAWADALRVSQIVTNLVKNACKYATPGTPVDIEVRRRGAEATVTVRDRGPGIPQDKVEAIFDRFHRLDDPQRMRTSGLGLGLYIARHLAQAMDGSLTVRSTRGVGTAFTLTLPTVGGEAAGPDAMPVEPAAVDVAV